MNIMTAGEPDIPELYRLQLLAFESEAAMIGSRDVPALQETEETSARFCPLDDTETRHR